MKYNNRPSIMAEICKKNYIKSINPYFDEVSWKRDLDLKYFYADLLDFQEKSGKQLLLFETVPFIYML